MKFKRTLKNWGPVLFWALLIFIGSSLPAPEISKVGWVSFAVTSFVHFVEFSILSFLIFRALYFAERGPEEILEQVKRTVKTLRFGLKPFFFRLFWELFVPKKLLAAILITVIYAAADELHQCFVPTRVCSFWDFFFDSFGAVVGAVLAKLILSF
ncbi:MAG: VanZ family protein [Patescibacteria group bacterium]|nr:VanZ family protein [Patescibacteria group bacterium]